MFSLILHWNWNSAHVCATLWYILNILHIIHFYNGLIILLDILFTELVSTQLFVLEMRLVTGERNYSISVRISTASYPKSDKLTFTGENTYILSYTTNPFYTSQRPDATWTYPVENFQLGHNLLLGINGNVKRYDLKPSSPSDKW